MERYELVLLGEFSAAHRLRMHDGVLEPLHGHPWRVEVHVEGDRLDAADLLVDFTVLQSHLDAAIAELHATCLNELPAFAACNPSTERVARHLHDRLAPELPAGVALTKVRVWETGRCAAAYIPTDRSRNGAST